LENWSKETREVEGRKAKERKRLKKGDGTWKRSAMYANPIGFVLLISFSPIE
jgi:hypothetical protein